MVAEVPPPGSVRPLVCPVLLVGLGSAASRGISDFWSEERTRNPQAELTKTATVLVRRDLEDQSISLLQDVSEVRIDFPGLFGSLSSDKNWSGRTWNLTDSVLTASPGGCRAMGRVAFRWSEFRIRAALDQQIRRLGQLDPRVQIQTIVIADAASATGTGMVWDVASSVQEYRQVSSVEIALVIPGQEAPQLLKETDKANLGALLLETTFLRGSDLDPEMFKLAAPRGLPFKGLFSRFYLVEGSERDQEEAASRYGLRSFLYGKLAVPLASQNPFDLERLRESRIGEAPGDRQRFPFSTSALIRLRDGAAVTDRSPTGGARTEVRQAGPKMISEPVRKSVCRSDRDSSIAGKLSLWCRQVENRADDLARDLLGWSEDLAHRSRSDGSPPVGGAFQFFETIFFLKESAEKSELFLESNENWFTLGPWQEFNQVNVELLDDLSGVNERAQFKEALLAKMKSAPPAGYLKILKDWLPNRNWFAKFWRIIFHRNYFYHSCRILRELLGAEEPLINSSGRPLRDFTISRIAARLLISKLANIGGDLSAATSPSPPEPRSVGSAAGPSPSAAEDAAPEAYPTESGVGDFVSRAISACWTRCTRLTSEIGEQRLVVALDKKLTGGISLEWLRSQLNPLPGKEPPNVVLVKGDDNEIQVLVENLFLPLTAFAARFKPYVEAFLSSRNPELHVFDSGVLESGLFSRSPFEILTCGNPDCTRDLRNLAPGVLDCPQCGRRIRWRCGNKDCRFIFRKDDEAAIRSRTCPSCHGFNHAGWWICTRHGRMAVINPIEDRICSRCVKEGKISGSQSSASQFGCGPFPRDRDCPNCTRVRALDPNWMVYRIPEEMIDYCKMGVASVESEKATILSKRHGWLDGIRCPRCQTVLLPSSEEP